MAAGISLDKENIDEFRWQLNHNQKLTKEQLTPVTWIDVPMPLGYAGFPLIEQLKLLEPFGKGNPKPLFAEKNLSESLRFWNHLAKEMKNLYLQIRILG